MLNVLWCNEILLKSPWDGEQMSSFFANKLIDIEFLLCTYINVHASIIGSLFPRQSKKIKCNCGYLSKCDLFTITFFITLR